MPSAKVKQTSRGAKSGASRAVRIKAKPHAAKSKAGAARASKTSFQARSVSAAKTAKTPAKKAAVAPKKTVKPVVKAKKATPKKVTPPAKKSTRSVKAAKTVAKKITAKQAPKAKFRAAKTNVIKAPTKGATSKKTAPKKVAPPKPASAKPAPKAMASASKPVPAKTPAGRPDAAPKVAAASPHPRTATPPDSKTVKPAKPAKPAPTPRKRARIRISHDGGPVATWISLTERPRSSSFIPAPPRASSPDLIAAPPASSDRLVDPTDLVGIADYRTVPVRVEIERSSGRIYISVNPEAAALHPGDGIEWDFRYLGGSDIEVQEVVIEFPERTPFKAPAFRSQKPGNARPHRQISGPSTRDGSGTAIDYVIRCINAYKTELATTTARASFA